MSRTGRLLLLVPTTSYRIGDFLAAAERLGAEVTVGSDEREVLEALSGDRALSIDLGDPHAATDRIAEYAGRQPLAAVVGVDQETAVIAARAAQRLGLPHNDPDAVVRAVDKRRFRTALANSGLNVPRFTTFPVEDDAARAAREVAYPCVLKPLALSAGRGVIRADDERAFVAAFARIRKILEVADADQPASARATILVEDYIAGAEVALEGLMEDGRLDVLALFDKPDPLTGPFFEETLYVTPSRLPATVQRAIVAATERALAALGLRHGPVHAELRVNDKGAWPIEIAPRSIGGLCARTLTFGAGASLEELILAQAMGRPVAGAAREKAAAGVMMIPIPAAGTLTAVAGADDARAVPGITDVTLSVPLGHPVVPPPEGYRYLGFIFAKGATPDHVEAALRAAHARVAFTIEPAGTL